MKRPGPTVDQLVAIIRAYQHANKREEMEAADARAVELLGPALPEDAPPAPRKPRAKVTRS